MRVNLLRSFLSMVAVPKEWVCGLVGEGHRQKGTTAKKQAIMLRCKRTNSGEFRLPVSSWSPPEGRSPTLLAKSLTSSSVRFMRLCQGDTLRRPGLLPPGPPHQPGQQPGEEQRKHPDFRNSIKSSCNTHGRWPHHCYWCFWKSLPTCLLIPKHTRNITEWRIPDSLTQQKTLKAAEKQNYTFLEEFSILESYITFINPYPALVLWMAEREKKHLRFYGAKRSYTRLMPAKMFPQLKGGLRS